MKLFALFSSYARLAVFAAAAFLITSPCYAQGEYEVASGARTISVVSTTAQAGTQVNVSVEIDSQGDEAAMSFALSWDPAIFSNPVATLGSGAPTGASLGLNVSQVEQGRLGVLVDAALPFGVSPPGRQVINLRLNVAADAPAGPSLITFVSSPTPLSVGNISGSLLETAFQVGTVTVIPSNFTYVTISGRVTSPSGQNLRNLQVSLIDNFGVRRIATTSSFGIYTFTDVAVPKEYTLTATSKRYRFAPKTITITNAMNNLDFVGLE
jgi:hypothetical protein